MIPQVATKPTRKDRLGTILARIGSIRNTYTVTPGVYAVGTPTPESPVLISANYKLSFDALRFALANISAWILVLDTRGVNVWCAAGKGTFSTAELVLSLQQYKVDQVVSHRQLVVPQLAATAVSAQDVKDKSGFRVRFGPVHVRDLAAFLQDKMSADETMRMVTFTFFERAVLVPVEMYLLLKPLLFILVFCFLLSGIGGEGFFSFNRMGSRGGILAITTLLGIAGGGILVPLLLPWLPGRQFWLKGMLPGVAAGFLSWFFYGNLVNGYEVVALFFWSFSVSSYLAMNFTGSTPFTSPSGVEYEMKRGIVAQSISAVIALVFWIVGSFG